MILTIVTKFAHTKTSGKRPCKVCDEEIQIGTLSNQCSQEFCNTFARDIFRTPLGEWFYLRIDSYFQM